MSAGQTERVAVIVVHGVADQAPLASVRQVAGLLANVDEGGTPAYLPFTEQTIRVPVRRLPPPVSAPAGAFFRASQRAGSTPIDHVFTESTLAEYEGEGPDGTFETIRLSATRRTPGGPVAVDLYEMYWADLSRVGTAAWRILGELYQVLLHVGSLGKHAASASVGCDRRWPAWAFHWSTAAASFLLAGPIAIFNAYLLVSAALVLVSLLPAAVHGPVAIAVVAVAALAAVAVALLHASRAPRALRIGGAAIGVLVLAGAAYYFIRAAEARFATPLFAAEVLLLALAGAGLLLRAYGRRRPRTGWWSAAAGLGVLAIGAFALATAPAGTDTRFSVLVFPGLRVAEALWFVLNFSWILFFALFWISLVTGSAFWRGISDPARRNRGERAVWTARITLVLPAAAFLLLTVALWAGLHESVKGRFGQPYPLSRYVTGLLAPASSDVFVDGAFKSGDAFIHHLLVSSLGPAFLPAAVLMALAATLAVFSVAPIVWGEVSPPPTNRLCSHLGSWLTSAFGVLRGAGRLMVLAFIVWPLLAFAGTMGLDVPAWIASTDTSALIVGWLGVGVGVPAAGLIAFRGRFQKLAAGFRAPVDVLLDVDGYLREHPRDSAPRARVFARYYSLLLHIAAAVPAYTKIVVIAHSQGTVITADLFRYLNFRTLWPLGVPVTLFTMGSPLRQLYARRFPDLYEWVWHDKPAVTSPMALPDIHPACNPDPVALGVTAWVNAYRSGDYVGRWLWRPDVCEYQFEASPTRAPWSSIHAPLPGHSHDSGHTRREICIGAGAHTHYWDGTAPEIAVELDYLIRS